MTIEVARANHDKLEGRVVGLERDMQNMSAAVTSLTDSVQKGFGETRRVIEEGAAEHVKAAQDLHARLNEHVVTQANRGRWNPGLLLAAITCAVLIGGVFVAFVQLSTGPLFERVSTMQLHMAQDDSRERADAERIGRAAQRIDAIELHLDRLDMVRERLATLEAKLELLQLKPEQ